MHNYEYFEELGPYDSKTTRGPDLQFAGVDCVVNACQALGGPQLINIFSNQSVNFYYRHA